jgi:RNA recognition motif-containing protein
MNIYVGNISFNATADDVRQVFERYGTVAKVTVITDRETGRSRGFGFVEMPNATEAKAAIEGLHGAALLGRSLTVNEARPREQRPPRE